jgi:dephospho-CoA kinase
MYVIGTVGLAGSGKGEAASVAREEDIPVVTMGDAVRAACRERGLDPETHHGEVARQLRAEDGPAAIADRTLPLIRDRLADADTVLVDGLRSDAEVDRFRAAFGDAFLLVSIEAPFEARARRLGDRGRDDSDLDEAALRERDERELGFGMDAAIQRADRTVVNDDSLSAFREQVRELLVAPERIRER